MKCHWWNISNDTDALPKITDTRAVSQKVHHYTKFVIIFSNAFLYLFSCNGRNKHELLNWILL